MLRRYEGQGREGQRLHGHQGYPHSRPYGQSAEQEDQLGPKPPQTATATCREAEEQRSLCPTSVQDYFHDK